MKMLSFWGNKRVFVTGHTGFKGSWLCKTLEMAGAEVTGYALNPSSKPNLYELCKPSGHSVIGDIRDFDSLHAAFLEARPEIAIHMAAQPLVIDSYTMPRYTYDVNVMGTVNFMECVRLIGNVKSVLNVTTDKVYLNQEREQGYREHERLCGSDPYSNSKSCSELVTSTYKSSYFDQAGVAVSTARSGNVIGGGDFSVNRLIPDCAKALGKGETIKVRNPDSIRPYLHVLDSIFAYLLIAEKQYADPSFSDTYNIGPVEHGCVKGRELVNAFCEAWGGGEWEHLPTNDPPESNILRLDCSKIKRMLGWMPVWDIDRAVNETAFWYRAYYQNSDSATSIMRQQIEEFMEVTE